MNKHLFNGALALGVIAVLWVASGFLGHNLLALTMTLLIAAVYGYGVQELRRFRQTTATLAAALEQIPEGLSQLGDWLVQVPAGLQNPVRLRIEGERTGLPGPALTPYLVGLLVMLGMLGTFLGMVVTLNGAVFALEGTSDLQAIRSAFATPIKGLGLAFGTSVAGVATSAMLGLMSAISRRERMLAAQRLDACIATNLRPFSHHFQRQETYQALQRQAQALPAVADQLQTLMQQMERMQQQLGERLQSNQENFHREVATVYTGLAQSVDVSLRDSLRHSAEAASASIRPVIESAMAGMAQESRTQHERMVTATQEQLNGLTSRFDATASTVASAWTDALANQAQTNAALVSGLGQSLDAFADRFAQQSGALLQSIQQAYAALQADQASGDSQRLQAWIAELKGVAGQSQTSAATLLGQITELLASSEALVRARIASETEWTAQHSERLAQLGQMLRAELGALRDEEAARANAAVQRLGELQTTVTGHLTTLGAALEDPITRLIHTASEAPRAAAEVIGKLRQEVSNSAARDNELLEERARILQTLNGLLDSVQHASAEQRAVIDSLVASSAVALKDASNQFAEQVGSETGKLAGIAAGVNSSAIEVAALGETFQFAVRTFSEANDKLIANLQRIEGAMDKSLARSDDQLAYYVAQAREIIDLSILSQKEVFEALRQLPAQQAALVQEAA